MLEQRHMHVLIVEDNPADARLVKELVKETGLPIDISLMRDGEGAIQMMERAAKGESPPPDLVLLDINLPKKNGHEVLASIREMDRLADTCVAMCSGSSSFEDLRRARLNGANAYLIKPIGPGEMETMIMNLRQMLIELNEGTFFAKCF